METFIQTLIYIHAALGGIALLSGSVAIITKKGKFTHRKAGVTFYFTMLGSVSISMLVALLPNHENPFLLSIGLFSTYFILMGKRALVYKHSEVSIANDRLLIILMFTTGILMIAMPLILQGELNIVTTVFGGVGVLFAFKDWRFIHDKTQWKSGWLLRHISRITGGYIAAVTAFMVVNDMLPGIIDWFLPGILGGVYITFWIKRTKRQTSKIAMSIAIIGLTLVTSQRANGQVYMEKQTRHRFAQLNLGMDMTATLGGKTTYFNTTNELTTHDLNGTFRPRFMIGGTHFWGHADFYIAIPLTYPSQQVGNQTVQFLRGVETAFKYYPWRIERKQIRPFLGTSIAPFYFEQSNESTPFGNGPEQYRTRFPLLAGITYQHKNQLIELSATWDYNNKQDYYISRNRNANMEMPPLYLSASWRWIIDTTIGAERSWESGDTQKITDQLAQKGKLNDFYVGVGLSSAFWLGESEYNSTERPYVESYGISIMPDFSAGYYLHQPDLNIGVAYRSYATSTNTYGVFQRAERNSIVFEAAKYLGDYHGFAPFLGPAISMERLRFKESFENQPTLSNRERKVGYGITFGWDIRPNRLQSWILRTSLRYFPTLNLDVSEDKGINFSNLEFNFIQFVMYPGRFF